jgi:hypothetical protein
MQALMKLGGSRRGRGRSESKSAGCTGAPGPRRGLFGLTRCGQVHCLPSMYAGQFPYAKHRLGRSLVPALLSTPPPLLTLGLYAPRAHDRPTSTARKLGVPATAPPLVAKPPDRLSSAELVARCSPTWRITRRWRRSAKVCSAGRTARPRSSTCVAPGLTWVARHIRSRLQGQGPHHQGPACCGPQEDPP